MKWHLTYEKLKEQIDKLCDNDPLHRRRAVAVGRTGNDKFWFGKKPTNCVLKIVQKNGTITFTNNVLCFMQERNTLMATP